MMIFKYIYIYIYILKDMRMSIHACIYIICCIYIRMHMHADICTRSTRTTIIIIIIKRTCKIDDFAVPADHKIKLKECEKKDKYLDLARELKKAMEHAGDNYTNCNWCVWNSNKRITKRIGGLGSWRTSGDHPNDSIVENGQNTKKSPGDLRGLAVTQTLWKTIG